MQRLKEEGQWRLDCRSIWQAGSRGKLLAAAVVMAWVGTSSTAQAGWLDQPIQSGIKDYSCPASPDLSDHKITHRQCPEARGTQTTESVTNSEASVDITALPTTHSSDALTCLALNVYWEARNQSVAGQLAVAQVTMNRVLDSRYADNVCDVVYQHKQFSWFWDGESDTPRELYALERAFRVASAALDGSGHSELENVTHYHAVYIKPYWKDHMVQVAMIGDHIFYAD